MNINTMINVFLFLFLFCFVFFLVFKYTLVSFATIRSRFYLGSIKFKLITHVLVSKVITKLVKLVGEWIYIPCHCPLGPPFYLVVHCLLAHSHIPIDACPCPSHACSNLFNQSFFLVEKFFFAKMGH
jgi:hypothetical protein